MADDIFQSHGSKGKLSTVILTKPLLRPIRFFFQFLIYFIYQESKEVSEFQHTGYGFIPGDEERIPSGTGETVLSDSVYRDPGP